MKVISGIYTITNKFNNKIYIGQSINCNLRLRQHYNKLATNKHHNLYLQNAWNKYGEDNFKFEILEECDEKFLISQEHYWCNILKTHDKKYGYNEKLTHPFTQNTKLSNATKDKIAKKATGRIISSEIKNKISKSLKGRKFSKEHIEKLKEKQKDYCKKILKCNICGKEVNSLNYKKYHGKNCGKKIVISQETRNKLSIKSKNRVVKLETKEKMKKIMTGKKKKPEAIEKQCIKVNKLDIDNNLLKKYKSIKEVLKDNDIKYSTFRKYCNKKLLYNNYCYFVYAQ